MAPSFFQWKKVQAPTFLSSKKSFCPSFLTAKKTFSPPPPFLNLARVPCKFWTVPKCTYFKFWLYPYRCKFSVPYSHKHWLVPDIRRRKNWPVFDLSPIFLIDDFLIENGTYIHLFLSLCLPPVPLCWLCKWEILIERWFKKWFALSISKTIL